jgi:hypothetical protein
MSVVFFWGVIRGSDDVEYLNKKKHHLFVAVYRKLKNHHHPGGSSRAGVSASCHEQGAARQEKSNDEPAVWCQRSGEKRKRGVEPTIW